MHQMLHIYTHSRRLSGVCAHPVATPFLLPPPAFFFPLLSSCGSGMALRFPRVGVGDDPAAAPPLPPLTDNRILIRGFLDGVSSSPASLALLVEGFFEAADDGLRGVVFCFLVPFFFTADAAGGDLVGGGDFSSSDSSC